MSVGAPVVTDVPRRIEERSRLNGATDAVITRDGEANAVQPTLTATCSGSIASSERQ